MIMALMTCSFIFLIFLLAIEAKQNVILDNSWQLQNDPVIRELLARVQHLESRDKHQQEEIDSLRLEVETHKERTTILEAQLLEATASKAVEVNQLFGSARYNSDDSSGQVFKANRVDSDSSVAKHESTGKSDRRIRQVDGETKVAFFATLGNHILHAGVKQIIPFDHVKTNIGNAYNPHVGVFVAPVSGVYVFSVTLMSYGSHSSHYAVSKNGSTVSVLYARGQDAPFEVAAQTVILQLAKGDDVDIQNIDPDEALYGYGYSTFSGFLLYQDYSSTNIVG